jgi:allophanate hydrolase
MQPVWIRELTSRRGPSGGPLAGVPFGIKDNIDLAGVPTTAACPSLDTPAAATATAVQRLIDAGAVPAGKTNMDQFATGLVGTRSPYGACHSVADPARVSGGSSSGSAVAVASGLVPLALGTDTAGSGRVPAAFNGIVGIKPTRGLISTRGVLPACRSLDCVTTFTRTVAEGREALEVLAGFDAADPWSRPQPPRLPVEVAARPRVIGIPSGDLDLSDEYRPLWEQARKHAATVAHLVPIDISAFLDTAKLLYQGPWVAERFGAFGDLLGLDGVDPTVRSIVAPGRDVTGADVFAGLDRLAALRQVTAAVWYDIDALLLPVAPLHPTLASVAADPVGVNSRLGTYTNFVNLLDLCAVAVPAGPAFGVQLIAPAFADRQLLDLAARWCGEPVPAAPVPAGSALVAVAGAHLTGLPLNPQLLALGATLEYRARTTPGYRLYQLTPQRPGLVRTGDGPSLPVEVWRLSEQALGALLCTIPAPLGLGAVHLDDGSVVPGFLAEAHGTRDAPDITASGGWRSHLRDQGSCR